MTDDTLHIGESLWPIFFDCPWCDVFRHEIVKCKLPIPSDRLITYESVHRGESCILNKDEWFEYRGKERRSFAM